MKQLITITFALLMSISVFCQETQKPIKSGILTLKNNEKVQFSNLRYEDDQVFYTNSVNQLEERLFVDSIISIEEGATFSEVEIANINSNSKTTTTKLPDGIYMNLNDLYNKKSIPIDYKLKPKNENKGFYFVLNPNGERVKNVFAFVEDGVLYVRARDINQYLTEHKGKQFKKTKSVFVKMNQNQNIFRAQIPLYDSGMAISLAIPVGVGAGILAPSIGKAIVIAAIGGAIIDIISASKKDLVINLSNNLIYLE